MKLVIKRVTGLGLVALAVLLLFGNAQAQKTLTIGMNELLPLDKHFQRPKVEILALIILPVIKYYLAYNIVY